MIKTIKYRDHRGALSDSMETVQEFQTKKELYDYIRGSISPFEFRPEKLKCAWYGWDQRIQWNTYLVSLEDYGVLGMTDGDINELPEGTTVDLEHSEVILNGINLFVSEKPIDPDFIVKLASRPLGAVRVEFNIEHGLSPLAQVRKAISIADWYADTHHKVIVTTNSPDIIWAFVKQVKKRKRRLDMSIWFRGGKAFRWKRVGVETVFKSLNRALDAIGEI